MSGSNRDPYESGFDLYLARISEPELLDREQESDLSKRQMAGRAAFQALASDELAEAEQEHYQQIADDGARASEKLYTSNTRLVVHIAKKYPFSHNRESLTQEGNIGLSRAVEKFDHSKGYKFSTYATWWIRQAIDRSFPYADQQALKVPYHAMQTAKLAHVTRAELSSAASAPASWSEVAEEIDVEEGKLKLILSATARHSSLDQPLGPENDGTLYDLIDQPEPDVGDVVASKIDTEWFLSAVKNQLSEIQYEVITRRFELNGHEHETLQTIGERHGITRERVRQIEMAALEKLQDYFTYEQGFSSGEEVA